MKSALRPKTEAGVYLSVIPTRSSSSGHWQCEFEAFSHPLGSLRPIGCADRATYFGLKS